jgi:predicted O-methyltransferase YrrM
MVKVKKTKVGGSKQVSYATELPKSDEKIIWKRLELQPNDRIIEIYKDGIVKMAKENIKLTSAISPAEGFHIYDLIKRNKFRDILEVGMANGLSSLYMLQALKENGDGGHLTSIDPFQDTQWFSAGLFNINAAGFSKQHTWIKGKSYDVLPQLLAKKNKYDLIFVDGMHLFDYTLIDVFYSFLLCRVGGIIIIDDILHKAPAKVIKYMDTNYKFLRRLKDIPVKTVGTYVMLRDDSREWDHYADF